MRKLAVALVALLAACKSAPGEVTQQRGTPHAASNGVSGDSVGTSGAAASPAAASSSGASAPSAYSLEELATLGFKSQPLDTGEALLCSHQCVCMKPLDCPGDGCISYEENIAAFRAALKAPVPGRTVSCRRAEAGRCDTFRYFDFEGDLHRRELRWFDETGTLVAQRNVADYDAYCEGQAQTLFAGSVPRCEVLTDRERICGEGERPALTALEDLRRFAAAPARRQ